MTTQSAKGSARWPRAPKILAVANVDTMVRAFLVPWLSALQDRGYEVHVACRSGEYMDGLAREGFHLHAIPFQRTLNPIANLAPMIQLWKLIRAERFDAITNHSPVGAGVGRIAAFFAGARNIIYTVHGFYFHENTPWLQRCLLVNLERILGRITDRFAFVSDEDRRTALSAGIVRNESHAVTIHDGIDLVRFRPQPPSGGDPVMESVLKARAAGQTVVGVVARLVKEKGYREFFGMTRSLAAAGKDVVFLAVGRSLPTDRDQFGETLKRQVRDAGLADRFIFAGHTPDVPDYLNLMDIFVLPSYREGLPRSVLEAMAAGLPVVTTDIRGCREAVVDGETGLIVPPKDTAALTAAVSRLVDHPETADRMGRAGRARAESLYDEEKVINRYLGLFDDLLRDRATAARETLEAES